jgi:hypothetical protein
MTALVVRGPMNLQVWLSEFCKLHERAYRGSLSPQERSEYVAARNELARAVLKTMRVSLQPGQVPRRSLRAALALPLTLQMPGGKLSTVTQDISSGGFSTFLPVAPVAGLVVPFSLRLSRGSAPIEGQARLAGVDGAGKGPTSRVGFAFQDLDADSVERVELTVFDSVVAQLTTAG